MADKEQQDVQEAVENESNHEEEVEQEEQTTPVAVETTLTGGRQRRSTQKFGFVEPKNEDEEEFKPPVGSGVKLSEMEAVAERISHMGKKEAETIKSLYNIMYSRRFQQKNIRLIKEHILAFSGVPDADEKTRQQLAAKMGRWMRSYLQDIMDVLGVDRSKKSFDEENKLFDKESLINRLVDWLCNPQESSKAVKRKASPAATTKKTKATAKSPKAAAGTKRKSTAAAAKKPTKKAKAAAVAEQEDEEEDATESEVEKDGDEDDDDDEESDFDEGDGKKKKKKTANKKKAPKKKAAAPRRGKEKVAEDEEDDQEDDDDEMDAGREDEAADTANGDDKEEETKEETKEAKEAKESPLGADVRQKVQDIIANGDASQLTVKKIVRQLSEDMGKDFSTQKAAIKDFVTNLQM